MTTTDLKAGDRHRSPWTRPEKTARLLWSFVQASLFRCSPHNAYRWRAWLLRRFGAKLGNDVRLRSTVRIDIPWNLTIGSNTAVGDFAILYCLGPLTLGRLVTVSQYAHLCAGSHDYTTPAMTLLRPPITIGDEVWLAADVFVGPGVTIGNRTVVGARASVFSDLPGDVVAVGNPARPIKRRPHVTRGIDDPAVAPLPVMTGQSAEIGSPPAPLLPTRPNAPTER